MFIANYKRIFAPALLLAVVGCFAAAAQGR